MIDAEIGKTFDRRSALFLTTGTILTSVLILRMLQMQLFEFKDYRKKSENNSFRIQMNMPKRGKLLSANNFPLSQDKPVYRIYIIPEETENIHDLVTIVSKDLHLKQKTIDRIYKQIKKQQKFQPVLIAENKNWDTFANLQAKNLPGLHVTSGFTRSYELGMAGAHVLGYVGAPKTPIPTAPFFTTGITGLEKKFNDKMAGTPGQTVMIANALGRITGEDKSQFIEPHVGSDIKTTLLENVQQVMYDALSNHNSGCGVALDIQTGNILAMVSTPSFDPNNFTDDDSDEYINSLRNNINKPFINKALEGLYPPGSTFKIVVALAALESGAIDPKQSVFCPGYWEYGDRKYHCWEAKGHGHVNLSDALTHSCDIYFYQLALKIGIDAIRSMALKLGFNAKYMDDIFTHEMIGVIPDRYWKEKNIGSQWVHGDTIISGIGQGFILTTCLQLAIMLSRVTSNKVITPNIIKSDTIKKFKSLGLQEKNIRAVLNGLERVTQPGGTASGSAVDVNDAHMGGKTGTSQVRNISISERARGVLTNEQLQWNMRNHGLFVGYAPTDKPKYVVSIVTEHSGGSGSAARCAAAVMRELLKDLK